MKCKRLFYAKFSLISISLTALICVQVRAVVNAITTKIQSSCLEMNAQELGNALYGLQDMTSDYPEVRLIPPL